MNNQRTIQIVIISIAILAGICVSGLTYRFVIDKTLDQSLGMAYVGIANALIGYLAGVLTKTTPTTSQKPTETFPS